MGDAPTAAHALAEDALWQTAGIILAAGESRRMGTNKMLLEIGGEPLVRRAARLMIEAQASRVIVVTGYEAERVGAALQDLPCDIVVNQAFRAQSSISMHCALRALDTTVGAVVVLLGDMVQVTSLMIRAVIARARATEAPLVVSRYGAVTAPPVLFRRSLFSELLAWNGEGCGKPVVRAHAGEAEYVDWPSGALADVDTTEDWARVQREHMR
jgi:molybdenum cofactor cytidylyltransferase